jgi:hypothetical protein
MKIKTLDYEDYVIVGKDTAAVGPRQEIIVPSSALGNLETPGRKCSHGVYIPANALDQNRAEFCSGCHPYIIKPTEDANVAPVNGNMRSTEAPSEPAI